MVAVTTRAATTKVDTKEAPTRGSMPAGDTRAVCTERECVWYVQAGSIRLKR